MEKSEGINPPESVKIAALYLAPGHSYFGRHGQPAADHPIVEVAEVNCVAGRGLRGDRFFDYKKNYKGQVTFFAWENYQAICRMLAVADKPPSALRRNVLTSGVDLNEFIDREFELQGVRFRGTEECRPCYWMEQAFATGAHEFLKGRGGLRAEILSDGVLRTDQP
jgi:MOSC domain-containing protein YiiM